MGATEVLTTRVTPEVKGRVREVVRDEFLTESVWVRRLVLQELRRLGARPAHGTGQVVAVRGECSKRREPTANVYVRLRPEERLLLRERSAARGMASATYVSCLVRAHLRSVAPFPKAELVALKAAVAELSAIGRNLNQIARAANGGASGRAVVREEFKAMMKVCEALRDHTKTLIKANRTSWETGFAQGQD